MMDNYKNLLSALDYLEDVLTLRLKDFFGIEKKRTEFKFPSFQLEESKDSFSNFIRQCELTIEEFITVMVALAPHIKTNFFEEIIGRLIPADSDLPEIGGIKGNNHRFMMPTLETAMFIMAGNDLERRFELLGLLDSDHFLFASNFLIMEETHFGEPHLSAKLLINSEYVELFTKGKISTPALSAKFPAKILETHQEWSDLVLPPETMEQLKEIQMWVTYHPGIMEDWGLKKKIKPGYRALFYGPPGTGKTLAATLIGKYTEKPVFRIDLSKIVSKYIGETEKNLASFFDKAENKDWCIFFDEADALFGKRTQTKESKDRYANQEVAYLLQRIEDYPGLVIMASNFKNNIDQAFFRRFNTMIYFPVPKESERLKIWEKAFPAIVEIEKDISLQQFAKEYELTGSNIMNVVHFACLQAKATNSTMIKREYLEMGIHREYKKESKI